MATKKVGPVGRFGARYGVGVKKRVLKIELKQRRKHVCPHCGFPRAKRKSAGIYQCTKCGSRFAGGAYTPSTMTGRTIQKMVSQKSFLPRLAELLEAKENALAGEVLEAEAPEFGEAEGALEEKPQRKERRAGKRARKAEAEKEEPAAAEPEAEPEGDE